MGIHKCFQCGCDPGPFFIWTSSRVVDREKLINKLKTTNKYVMKSLVEGVELCLECFNELKEDNG